MERKIGEIIEFDDVELKVVEITKEERQANESCAGCYFFHEDTRECSEFKEDAYAERQLGSCYENKRTDKKSVKFINVRKYDNLEKQLGEVTGVRTVPIGDVSEFNEIKPLKISSWEDLINAKLATIRGLSAEVKKAGKQAVVHIFLNEKAAAPIAVIDWMPTLKDVVDVLKKFGFDLEYEESFNLVKFLKENLCKKTFKVDDFNYYFMIDDYSNTIRLSRTIDDQSIGTLYLKPKVKDIITIIEGKFEEEKVTKIQLIDALEELGWL